MLTKSDLSEKIGLQNWLRQQTVVGSIDVNIMTKLNRDVYKNGVKLAPEYCDAMASLRGYANSDLESAVKAIREYLELDATAADDEDVISASDDSELVEMAKADSKQWIVAG